MERVVIRMEKVMRGHHLLCVHGFTGMGYSTDFIQMMKDIVDDIRDSNKDFMIKVVASFDDICTACPNKGEKECQAGQGANEHALSMDGKVIRHLGLTAGKSYQKSELVSLTAEKVAPSDLDYLCARCSWLSFGVCKDGIEKLRKAALE